ncbi:MAG: hypothetical protein ABI555_07335 [Chloroflexota bacterium]
MAVIENLVVLDQTAQDQARCMVCGNSIGPGEGVFARYGERTLRFKCPGCMARFQSDPERYLAGDAGGCCKGEHGGSPAGASHCD